MRGRRSGSTLSQDGQSSACLLPLSERETTSRHGSFPTHILVRQIGVKVGYVQRIVANWIANNDAAPSFVLPPSCETCLSTPIVYETIEEALLNLYGDIYDRFACTNVDSKYVSSSSSSSSLSLCDDTTNQRSGSDNDYGDYDGFLDRSSSLSTSSRSISRIVSPPSHILISAASSLGADKRGWLATIRVSWTCTHVAPVRAELVVGEENGRLLTYADYEQLFLHLYRDIRMYEQRSRWKNRIVAFDPLRPITFCERLCMQSGCTNLGDVLVRLLASPRGERDARTYYRFFCRRHSTRGTQDAFDCEANCVVVWMRPGRTRVQETKALARLRASTY